jgi:hydrophobe/amphiphile efflux-1 (HAE1) family protein
LISAFNSLTLSPALAALLLQPKAERDRTALPRPFYAALAGGLAWMFAAAPLEARIGDPALTAAAVYAAAALAAALAWLVSPPLDRALAWFFRVFNIGFARVTDAYTRSVGALLRVSALVLLVYGGLLFLTWWGFTRTPTGFIPAQDKGYLLVNVQLPDAASGERTRQVMQRVEAAALKTEGVKNTVALAGESLLMQARAPNFGSMYVLLDDFHDRTRRSLHADAIAARLQARLQLEVTEATVNVFGAPPVEGLGTAGGVKLIVEDRSDLGLPALQGAADDIVARGSATKELAGLYTSFRANTPWLSLDIDRQQAKTMGVSMAEVFNALQVYLGSFYINDFNRFGRTWQVNVQADAKARRRAEDLRLIKLRSDSGRMVPLASVASVRDVSGPVLVMRYNMYPSAAVNASAAPGYSSGQAIAVLGEVARSDLPPSMRSEWTELALLELQAGNTAMWVFLLAVVLVFLVLAAQYESWSLPLAVILVVPMCLLCSVAGVLLAAMDVNIFTQVGFIVLVGLACKNAILIVEFAKARRDAGVPRREATLAACRLRLRPIIMTSLAFILGVVPLVLSTGAGAEMRRTLGTAVFSGMLGVTLFGIFLTPVFYSVIQWAADLRERRRARQAG